MPFIPLPVLALCLADPFYRKCCLCGGTPVQLHEHLNYGGRQVKEKFCTLPVCKFCHDIEKRKDVNEKLTWIMVNRATDDELRRYSKITSLIKKRELLNEKYGPYKDDN